MSLVTVQCALLSGRWAIAVLLLIEVCQHHRYQKCSWTGAKSLPSFAFHERLHGAPLNAGLHRLPAQAHGCVVINRPVARTVQQCADHLDGVPGCKQLCRAGDESGAERCEGMPGMWRCGPVAQMPGLQSVLLQQCMPAAGLVRS